MAKVLANVGGALTEVLVSAVGGAGVGVVDFGAGATDTKLVVTGQAGILAGSAVFATVAATATAAHSADEHWVDGPAIIAGGIVPGTGFTIYAATKTTALFGTYTVHWSWV